MHFPAPYLWPLDDPLFGPCLGPDGWFFALQPDPSAAQSALRSRARICTLRRIRGTLIRPQNLHVSLHSIGQGSALPESILRGAREAAGSVVVPPFEVSLDHTCDFASADALVLCGDTGVASLKHFHQVLGAALRRSGVGRFVADRFNPHMTLLYSPQLVGRLDVEPVTWAVKEFVLLHSLVGQSKHQVEGRWPLRSAP